MPDEIHVDDIGTVFRATLTDAGVVVDISAATTRELAFQRPDGTLVTKPAVLTTDGTDGQMQYVSEVGFLDQAGVWFWQPYVEFASGSWHGNTLVFPVASNLG